MMFHQFSDRLANCIFFFDTIYCFRGFIPCENAEVEIGGTAGDIESQPFLEAIRQLRQDVGRENTLYIHLTLVPFIGAAGELKTKPTQHSVRDLRSIGIQPDILLCRTDRFLDADIKRKISLFCDVHEEAVITAKDVDTIYEVPLVLKADGTYERAVAGPNAPSIDVRSESRKTSFRSTSARRELRADRWCLQATVFRSPTRGTMTTRRSTFAANSSDRD